jgi:hypothetical protein
MNCGQINPSRIGNMKTNLSHFRPMAAAIAAAIILRQRRVRSASRRDTQLEPGEIALGQSAQLTITTSGDGNDASRRPPCRGWSSFPSASRARWSPSTASPVRPPRKLIEVIPQHAGKFTIPALSRGAQALVICTSGNGRWRGAGQQFRRVQPAAAGRQRIVRRANQLDQGRDRVRAAAFAEA